MATIGDINQKISNLTTTDTNQYVNSDRLIDLNYWYNKIVGMILDSQDEVDFDDARYTDYPGVTVPLTTNRDYSFGQTQTNVAGLTYSILKIKDVSIGYDGVNFYKAYPMDVNEFNLPTAPVNTPSIENTTIDGFFSRTAPRYDTKNNSISIYPVAQAADVTAGGQMMVEWYRSPVQFTSAELTAGTVSPGIDPEFHMMLAYGPAYEFCEAKGLPQTDRLRKELEDMEMRLRKQYSTKQMDRKYQFVGDYQTMK